ncbi:hypothetical protein ACFLX2_00045 [Candidatus Dependentiae bacterium]
MMKSFKKLFLGALFGMLASAVSLQAVIVDVMEYYKEETGQKVVFLLDAHMMQMLNQFITRKEGESDRQLARRKAKAKEKIGQVVRSQIRLVCNRYPSAVYLVEDILSKKQASGRLSAQESERACNYRLLHGLFKALEQEGIQPINVEVRGQIDDLIDRLAGEQENPPTPRARLRTLATAEFRDGVQAIKDECLASCEENTSESPYAPKLKRLYRAAADRVEPEMHLGRELTERPVTICEADYLVDMEIAHQLHEALASGAETIVVTIGLRHFLKARAGIRILGLQPAIERDTRAITDEIVDAIEQQPESVEHYARLHQHVGAQEEWQRLQRQAMEIEQEEEEEENDDIVCGCSAPVRYTLEFFAGAIVFALLIKQLLPS